jgi:hypothetical protein
MSADDKMKRMMIVLRKENHREKRNEIMRLGRRSVEGKTMVFIKAAQMNEIRRAT